MPWRASPESPFRIDLRDAALSLAIERVGSAYVQRGIFP